MNCSIQNENGGVRIRPEGDVDMHVAPQLRKIFHKVLEDVPSHITVDLSDVPFMDSSGIATIVEVLKLSRQQGGSLRIEGCQETVRDTFDIAGLTGILGIS